MVALHRRLLNRAIHALDLAVGPRVSRFGQAVLHAVFAANAVEAVPTGQELMRLWRELDAIVGQYGMHFIRQLFQHAPQEFGRHDPFRPWVQFSKRHLAGTVNGHEEVLAAFFGLHLGKVDVQIANGVVLELLFRRALPVFAQRQAADAVALETAVQHRARQVRNRGLQRVEAIVQRQQRMPTKGHGNGFLLSAEHRRTRFRPHARIHYAGAFAPLGYGPRVDAV